MAIFRSIFCVGLLSLLSENAVCRTAPAILGRLILSKVVFGCISVTNMTKEILYKHEYMEGDKISR